MIMLLNLPTFLPHLLIVVVGTALLFAFGAGRMFRILTLIVRLQRIRSKGTWLTQRG